MTAFMSPLTMASVENQSEKVVVWTNGTNKREKSTFKRVAIRQLPDFPNGLIVYSDGTQETVELKGML